jgi:hypothetical protein
MWGFVSRDRRCCRGLKKILDIIWAKPIDQRKAATPDSMVKPKPFPTQKPVAKSVDAPGRKQSGGQ